MANTTETIKTFDRQSETKAFDETKAGVKGLVDGGITKVPRIFINEKSLFTSSPSTNQYHVSIPVIDLNDTRTKIVQTVKEACEKWGIFHIVNHELPVKVMDEMIEGVRRFNEQDTDVKKKYYTRDTTKKFQYNSNFYIYNLPAASWKDNLLCVMAPDPPDYRELPDVLRDIMFEYSQHVTKVGNTVYSLLSEALGLDPNHLKDIGCAEAVSILGNYYPVCPEPELTFGVRSHVDFGGLTILLQDKTGGLQILYEDQWVDVHVVPKGLIINVGDFIQLITNDKFKSLRHRVLVNKDNARVSVATFISPKKTDDVRMYGPIKELLTEDEPAIYKDTTYVDYVTLYHSDAVDTSEKISRFKANIVHK